MTLNIRFDPLERLVSRWFFISGINQIAAFIGVDPGKVIEWARELVEPPPIFKMNGVYAARKADLRKWKKWNRQLIEAAVNKPLPLPPEGPKPPKRGRWSK